MRKTLPFLLVTCLLTLCGYSLPCDAATLAEGATPALTTPTLDGKTFDLAALRGKVVIVHFWATWCPACREEMPVLDAFALRHHAQGLEVIAISVDRPREHDGAVAAMRDFHFPASLVSDATANDFGTPGALPMTYVIDRQGAVAAALTPEKTPLTLQSLEQAVLPLLGK